VEARTRELAGAPVHELQVLRERTELGETGPVAPPEEPGRVPPRVEGGDLRQRREFLARGRFRVHQGSGHAEMRVHGLAGHEQMHDLARALEDAVDAEVAHEPFDGDRRLAS